MAGGLERLVSWLPALVGIYGRAGASSALDPLGRSLFADEKRQDKQEGRAIGSRRKAYQTFGFQSYRTTTVLCKCYRRILAI
jgi:hypothetical protein